MKRKDNNPVIPCENCENPTQNPRFCSRSCSASYNNKVYPKRANLKPWDPCVVCGGPKERRVKKRCGSCKYLVRTSRGVYKSMNDITKGEYKSLSNATHNRIRIHARNTAKAFGKLENCLECGYSKCVECAHVRPISSFDDSALVSEINSIDNLIGLCPNHHWEQERGLLKIKATSGIRTQEPTPYQGVALAN